MKMTADELNDQFPIGTPVVYQPVRDGKGTTTATRSEAWELGHGAAVVSIKGQAGGVSVEHVTVLSD